MQLQRFVALLHHCCEAAAWSAILFSGQRNHADRSCEGGDNETGDAPLRFRIALQLGNLDAIPASHAKLVEGGPARDRRLEPVATPEGGAPPQDAESIDPRVVRGAT